MNTLMREKIRMIMKLKGFSQNDLADKIGASRISVNRFLCGQTDMNSTKVFKILEVLDIAHMNRIIDENIASINPNKYDGQAIVTI